MTARENMLRLRQLSGLRLGTDGLCALFVAASIAAFAPMDFAANASETAGNVQASTDSTADESANQSADYHLSPGDVLMIVVYDQPQLSGEFIIDGGGGLLLPLAGPVSLSGLTLVEAQKLIQDRFADGVLVKPGVSIRIKEYRPIFVTGSVRRPGSYPFIMRESVKAALASAGGKGQPIEKSLNGTVGAVSDFITAQQQVRQLEANYAALFVRNARLEAQRDERENFVMPTLVGLTPRSVDFERAYTTENEVFNRLTETYRGQVQTLLKQRPLIQAEIDAVMNQIARQKEHLDIVKNHLADLELLFSKGLLTKAVLQNQQIEKSIVEGQVSNLQAEVARLQQSMGELDVRLGDVRAAFVTQTVTQLQDTSQRLRDIENSIGPARRLLNVKAQGADSEGNAPDYTIRISRVVDGSMTTFDATEETILSPGDVVEAIMKRPISDSDSSPSTQAILELDPTSAVAESAEPASR